jgi:hypothetical protein
MSTDALILDERSPSATLRAGIARLRLRLRLLLFLRLAASGVAAIAGVGAAATLALRLFGVDVYPWVPEIAIGAAVVVAAIYAAAWRLPDALVAGSADRRLDLRDRLGTAVRMLLREAASGMAQAAVIDAAATARGIRPAQVYPLRAYRSTKWMPGCLVALALAQALNIPPLLLSRQQQVERQELRRQAAALQPIAQKLLEQSRKSGDPGAEKLARRLQKLAGQFKRGAIGKKQALLSLAEMQKQMEKLQTPVAMPQTAARVAESLQRENRDKLAAEAQRLAQQAANAGNRDAQRKFEDLAAKAQQTKDPAEARQLRGEIARQAQALGQSPELPSSLAADLASALSSRQLEQAREQLSQTKDALNSHMSEAERQQLARDLQEMAQGLQDSDLKDVAQQLAQAAEGLSKSDMQAAQRALDQAAKDTRGKGG